MLAHLHQGHPVMGSELLSAVVALRVLLNELHQLSRLDLHVLTYLAQEHNLELQPFGMRFSPDKTGRLQLYLIQPLHLLEQDGHHLLALTLAVNPRRPLKPHAVPAVVNIVALQHLLLLQGLDGARGADRPRRRDELYTAQGAQDCCFGFYDHHCCNTFIMLQGVARLQQKFNIVRPYSTSAIIKIIRSVLVVGEYYLEIVQLHQPYQVLVAHVGEDAVLVQVADLQHAALVDEKELLPLRPGVLERVGKQLLLANVVLVLAILLGCDADGVVGVVAVVQEEVVVRVLISDALLEQFLDLLQVGQGVHVGHLVLLGVVVDALVVELGVQLHALVNELLGPHQYVAEHILLLHLGVLHGLTDSLNNYQNHDS